MNFDFNNFYKVPKILYSVYGVNIDELYGLFDFLNEKLLEEVVEYWDKPDV